MKVLLWVALAAGGLHAAQAQPPSTAAPTAKASDTPVLVAPYRSAFEGFRPWRDEEPQDWRRANDEMKQLGGHNGHLRAPSAARPAGEATPKAQEKKQ